jgi:CMP-N-acetylneuraminic acid synthetase
MIEKSMSGNHKVAALVPARGGSTSVPNKNLQKLGDRPLVAWPIRTAMSTPEVDKVYTTTDNEEIATVSREYGASVIDRPPELATDDALVIDAVEHAIDHLSDIGNYPDQIVLLEPTCPFRSVENVKKCLDRISEEYNSASTFTEADPNPHRTWTLTENEPEPFVDGANPWVPRQQTPEVYQLTGACYAFETDVFSRDDDPGLLFGRSAAIEMSQLRSLDIDTPVDLQVARSMIAEGLIDTEQ